MTDGGALVAKQDAWEFLNESSSLFEERILLLQGLVPFLDIDEAVGDGKEEKTKNGGEDGGGGTGGGGPSGRVHSGSSTGVAKTGKGDGDRTAPQAKGSSSGHGGSGTGMPLLDMLMLWLLRIDIDLKDLIARRKDDGDEAMLRDTAQVDGEKVESKHSEATETKKPEVVKEMDGRNGAGEDADQQNDSSKEEKAIITDKEHEKGHTSKAKLSLIHVIDLLQAQVLRSLRGGVRNNDRNRSRVALFFLEVVRISGLIGSNDDGRVVHPHLAAEISSFISCFYPKVNDTLIRAAIKGGFSKDLASRKGGGYAMRRFAWLFENDTSRQVRVIREEISKSQDKRENDDIGRGANHEEGALILQSVAEEDGIGNEGLFSGA